MDHLASNAGSDDEESLDAVVSEPSLAAVAESVRVFAEVMRANNIRSLDITTDVVKIRLRGYRGGRVVESIDAAAPRAIVKPSPPSAAVSHTITAPMIGTYYSSASPGQPPFIRIGDQIVEGQTVGIIEAMKIMNEIVADRAGIVAEIVVANGQAVEYGSPLIRLQPDEDDDAR